jgi:microfibrillar-associated protein 1
LQKYYHKGAFFQDEAYNNSEHIYNRDFNLPTWEDSIDRSNVPGIMEKRRGNLFKKGQSKYTHLTNEDTTNFDPDFRIPDNINNNILKKIGGYKGQNKFNGK